MRSEYTFLVKTEADAGVHAANQKPCTPRTPPKKSEGFSTVLYSSGANLNRRT